MGRKFETEFPLTKILATLGPASEDAGTIGRLIESGVRVFRINFSHGTFDDYERMLDRVRQVSRDRGVYVGVLGDLCGPKLRVGKVVEGGVQLTPGSHVEFRRDVEETTAPVDGAPVKLSTNYPMLVEEVEPGQNILLDDGKVRLVCREKTGRGAARSLVCKVIHGGTITSRKGVNLPDTKLSAPALTEKDEECVKFAVKKEFDFLALSFVRSSDDVKELKQRLQDLGAHPGYSFRSKEGREFSSESPLAIPVISKIEKPQALDDLEAIVDASDAVMVARGDLGVEMDLEEVPLTQKRIIAECHERGRPVIVATQMLESMINSPTPTRAEVSDVANAIFDGADSVMLSGETAAGKYPVESAEMMHRVAQRTDDHLKSLPVSMTPPRKIRRTAYHPEALASGVGRIVRELDARLVVVWSHLDGSSVFLSQNRLSRPVLVFSSNESALRRSTILYGAHPVYMEPPANSDDFIRKADRLLLENNVVAKDDPIVFVLGEGFGKPGVVNKIGIHYAGETE